MKKIISLILVAVMCLSLCACGNSDACNCDCAQCAQCEKKTQTTEITDVSHVEDVPEATEPNNNVIEFETPIVVAEDEYLRVELVKFYEDYVTWTDHGQPSSKKADSTTEGATLEKFVVFKLCNKTDHALTTYLNDAYLGIDGADSFDIDGVSRMDTAAGKNVLRTFLIQTGANTALESMDALYSLDGDFSIFHKGEDGVMRNNYHLKFSIPNGMNSNSTTSVSTADALTDSIYLGKWQVTDVTFADENISSHMEEDAALWENYFKGVLSAFDKVYLVFSESGDCYYHTEKGTTTSTWAITEAGVKAGGMVLDAENDRLVCERDGYLLYWEKISDDQTIPEA